MKKKKKKKRQEFTKKVSEIEGLGGGPSGSIKGKSRSRNRSRSVLCSCSVFLKAAVGTVLCKESGASVLSGTNQVK